MNTKDTTRPTGQKKRTTASAGKASPSGRRPSSAGTATHKRPAAVPKAGNAVKRPAGTKTAKRPQTKRRQPVKAPSADVVYTQPGPFNKYRFLLYLATVIAVVLAIVFGMSIFFKVSTVTVTGNEKYSAWDIREASGIQDGENLLSISEPKISNSITSKLSYVNKVRVGIKLPDTVKIEIVEFDVVYSVEATDGSWWLMRADGVLAEKVNSADAEQHTKILGIQIADPAVGQQAVAYQPTSEGEGGETVPVTVLASEQLEIAVSVAQFLESNGIIGAAKSINVADVGNLEMWFDDKYQVLLGDALELGYKIRSMKSAMDQIGDYQSGVLDVSYTTWPNEVGYTPFS